MPVTFADDDAGYLRFLAENPDGLVVNHDRVPRRVYLVLHRASCADISRHGRTHWTDSGLVKTCSTDRVDLEDWARSKVGGALLSCRKCNP